MSSPTLTSDQPKGNLRTFLEMIKFEHSVFALPYAMLGMMFASIRFPASGWPGFQTFFLILIAMVSCRTAAMTYNRIADRDIDAINPRTRMRAIPAGLLSLGKVNLYFLVSIVVFLLAAALLNPLTLILGPLAIGVTVFYSRTKRFTWLCHYWLGLSLGIAPTAAWISVTGKFAVLPILLTFAVMFWTAGFDIIYALQDEEFDRENQLHSIPARFGKVKALAISRWTHVASIFFLWTAFFEIGSHPLRFLPPTFATAMLVYEQSLVKPDDLSKVNFAFFTLNGMISIGVFALSLLVHFTVGW